MHDVRYIESNRVRGCEWGEPTNDKELENITNDRQNEEKNYRLATEKLTGIYRQPIKVDNFLRQPIK